MADPQSTGNPLDPRRRPGTPGPVEGGADADPPPAAGPPAQDAADPAGRAIPPAHAGGPAPDPDPGNTTGLEAGGGVAPGDTPPSEASTTWESAREPQGPSRLANLAIPLGIIGVIALAALALLIGRLADLF